MADNDSNRNADENGETAVTWAESETRTVTIHRTRKGFGFKVSDVHKKCGKIRLVKWELSVPIQRVSEVTKGGAAEKAGIMKGDEIIEVNGNDVKGATHKQIMDLINSGGDVLTLTVNSVTSGEDKTSDDPCPDNEEEPLFPISIPDYSRVEKNSERFVLYNIYTTGRLCCRRYREFAALHVDLKKEFPGFHLPKLPEKTLFILSDTQIEARRRGLERYLQKACATKLIADSEMMEEFLTNPDDEYGTISKAVLPVVQPGGYVTCITVRRGCYTEEAYQAFTTETKLCENISPYFALFEIVEDEFPRKLEPKEQPYCLYKQRYWQDRKTSIAFRKWLFNLSKEIDLIKHVRTSDYFILQAIDDIKKGRLKPASRLHELEALLDLAKTSKYIEIVKSLEGYGEISFPRCLCDAREEGPVVATIGLKYFKLHACKDDGTMESYIIQYTCSSIKEWKIDEESFAFMFRYDHPDRGQCWVKIFTPYYDFMFSCFDRIEEERKWRNCDDFLP